jgi:hypothetical protein
MPTLETEKLTNVQLDVIRSAWNQIRAQLETEKVHIYEAIGNYPTPIAGCDQQFNYLLEERARISRELDQLNESCLASITIKESIKLMKEFMQSSSSIDPQAEQAIQAYLEEGLAPP